MNDTDDHELWWWRHFQTKCFNRIPVGTALLGDRFKIMVQNPFTDEWEDVWTPKSSPVDLPIAETPQLEQEPLEAASGSPPIPG